MFWKIRSDNSLILGDRLSTFFLSRIEDGAQGLGYHARGILALESMAPFSRETFQKLLNTYEVFVFWFGKPNLITLDSRPAQVA